MKSFQFYAPTNFVFGRGVESQCGPLAQKAGAHKVAIVYGGGSVVRSGLLDRVKASLTEAGLSYVELSGVKPNPMDDKVREGIALCRAEGVDFMLPVGGGSVIDTAKTIAIGVDYDGDFWDFYSGKAQAQTALPVGVILTIPAAGSEGSSHAVITNAQAGMAKVGIGTPLIRPLFALMNPELTFTLPPYQTMSGVADMMAHIMERYFSNTPDVSLTDRLCEGALRSIMETAPRLIDNPEDYEARANIMWAGTIAHNDLCGLGRDQDWGSHHLEHELSSLYNVTHGAGLAVVFPAWMRYLSERPFDSEKGNPKLVAKFAIRVMGVASEAEEPSIMQSPERVREVGLQGIERLKAFFKSVGLPVTMQELYPHPIDIPQLVKNLMVVNGENTSFLLTITPEIATKVYEYCCE